MTTQPGQQRDDPSSAPESGTVCDPTSGNRPFDRGCNPAQATHPDEALAKDDPSIAGEER